MGKYIRTKDRICEFEIEFSTMPNFIGVKGKGIGGLVCKEEIVRQADTIEELCDEFVVVNDSNFYNGRDVYYQVYGKAHHRGDSYYDFSFEEIRTRRRIIHGIIYGAIWTDKGLIYVAKMNNKGEFELL